MTDEKEIIIITSSDDEMKEEQNTVRGEMDDSLSKKRNDQALAADGDGGMVKKRKKDGSVEVGDGGSLDDKKDTKEENGEMQVEKKADVPLDDEKKADAPLDAEKKADAPLDAEKKADVPLDDEKKADVPLDDEKKADAPLDAEKKADAPLDEKKADAPLDEKKADAPLDEKKANVPLDEKKADAPLDEKKADAPLDVKKEEKGVEELSKKEQEVPKQKIEEASKTSESKNIKRGVDYNEYLKKKIEEGDREAEAKLRLIPIAKYHASFFNTLSITSKNRLLDEFQTIDIARCLKELERCMQRKSDMVNDVQPVDESRYKSKADLSKELKDDLCNEGKRYFIVDNRLFRFCCCSGLQLIAENKVAVIVLAGGEGSRLKSYAPKGAMDIGLPSGKSLFQLQAERIIKLQKLATEFANSKNQTVAVKIEWLIMVSPATVRKTEKFFQEHAYFGLDKAQIHFFRQGTMPCFSFTKKVLFDSVDAIAMAPDGNGGMFAALKKSNLLHMMEKRGIEFVHVYCVDNVLVRVGDPLFFGYCKYMKADCATKVIKKTSPTEQLGVVCCDPKPKVLEYSEISSALAEKRDEKGELVFRAGNIANHVFTFQFLKKMCNDDVALPYHLAKKAIPYVQADNVLQIPVEPNGYKLEKFIFDVFPYSENFAILEVPRNEEFSPLKNPDLLGVDCPTTCRADLYRLHRQWIIDSGGKVPELSQDSEQFVCEISPLVSYAGEDIHISNEEVLSSPFTLK
ncbi:UDP-N-acetylhexosamine pyrophosphorylase [Trichinella britovi]|uniref:UDP-N-acetylglucosamine diphosphorylase n=1 Tax=Trichinella britovi TaxID=45882 RepID=A0A0V1CNB3_TRIBR|nr:UDP-N-acetylhexosamine pyrophosphorylase [Trichinella britovi]